MAAFTLTTLGCKVNQYEASAMAEALRRAGLAEHDPAAPCSPDLCVVHTCGITATAARKSRQAIRRLAAAHPEARIVVTGCYATLAASEIRRLPGVAAVVGHREDVAAALERLGRELHSAHPRQLRGPCARGNEGRMIADGNPQCALPSTLQSIHPATDVKDSHAGTDGLPTIGGFGRRQRAIVKVQDGCDAFCSYCIVPHLRSEVRSRSAHVVADEARALIAAGCREIVLCGIFLGAYGQPTCRRRRWQPGPDRLAGLVDHLAALPGLERLRLSSLEPGDVTDALLDVMGARPNVCPHLHLPLQSGSPRILARMNRQYTADEYAATVDRVRRRLDRPAFTTDVLVGFPGETDEDFQATLRMARHAGFAKIHAFPFSARQGTAAWNWRSEGPAGEVVKARCAALAELEQELARAYRAGFVGQTVRVLLEDDPDAPPGSATGLTERYVRVEVAPAGGPADLAPGRLVDVRVEACAPEGLRGQAAGPSR